ncbi:MAG: hypothetical protein JWM10_4929 [Myxococcaceae bacterium]|nr:hypothetical protein [Myxococcaceae bacterium]
MSRWGKAWPVALCVTFAACGGDDPAPAHDADASVDATFNVGRDVGRDTGVDVIPDLGRDTGVDVPVTTGIDACDPSAHVDCFFAVECSGGVARRSANSPYPCCNQASCSAAFAAGICWVGRTTCRDGCGPARRWRCDSAAVRARYSMGGDLTDFCAEGGHAPGDRCTADADCAPQRASLPGRLRCDRDAGGCARAPRPAVDAGAACAYDDECAEGMVCGCDRDGAPGRCGPEA